MPNVHPLAGTEGPKHGDRGSGSFPALGQIPGVVAVSRQPGSRGGRLANYLARKAGYTLFDRESLEFISRDPGRLAEVNSELDSARESSVEDRMRFLAGELAHFEELAPLARTILVLAARGGVVFLGRGAGFLLPHESTLHLRVVADQADRERYLSQWLRLPADQAERTLADADRRREDFLHRHFGRAFVDPVTYDATLNTSRLGEEGASGVALQAFLCRFPPAAVHRDAS